MGKGLFQTFSTYQLKKFFLGAGKSDVIRVAAMHAERLLRKSGDKPNHPRILLTGHTGKAASLIGEKFLKKISFSLPK